MASPNASPSLAEMRSMLRQLQEETILWVLPVLVAASFALYVLAGHYLDPLKALLPCLWLLSLATLVWVVCRRSYLAAAWLLVGGCVAALFGVPICPFR
jgi:hypothetical protein